MFGPHLTVVAVTVSINDILTFLTVSNEIRKHYADIGSMPPPMPDDAEPLLPCTLLVTEREEFGTHKRIGRVRLFRADYTSLHDKEWDIARAARVSLPARARVAPQQQSLF